MKVSELIKALSEQPQDAEVFRLTHDGGLAEIRKVATATNTYDELNDIIGEVFVFIQ